MGISTKEIAKNEIDKLLDENKNVVVDRLQETKFLMLCDFADSIAEEFEGETPEFSVSLDHMGGAVWVDMPDMILQNGNSHPFYEYMKHADLLQFSKAGDDMLRVVFGVEDLLKSV